MSEASSSRATLEVQQLASTSKPQPRTEKALPATPTAKESEAQQETIASTSRLEPELPPLPVYSEASEFQGKTVQTIDKAYQQKLCNDFIQGERAYIDTLRQCVKNEQVFGTSLDLLLSLLSVIQIGEDFLASIQGDPSPLGIASSFLRVCRPLEAALLKWSEEISRISVEGPSTLPQAPSSSNVTRRGSILKRVSVLWHRKSTSSTTSDATAASHTLKPDRVWQKQPTGAGLFEMSVLPAQRVSQYRYLIGGTLLVQLGIAWVLKRLFRNHLQRSRDTRILP